MDYFAANAVELAEVDQVLGFLVEVDAVHRGGPLVRDRHRAEADAALGSVRIVLLVAPEIGARLRRRVDPSRLLVSRRPVE